MKIGTYQLIPLSALLICIALVLMSGCRSDQEPTVDSDGSDRSSDGGAVVPHGYMARLEQVHDGRRIGFGPFVGYYFRPGDPVDLSRLQFVCFNENKFYSSDMPNGARLYEGTAVRATLPKPQFEMHYYKDSITG